MHLCNLSLNFKIKLYDGICCRTTHHTCISTNCFPHCSNINCCGIWINGDMSDTHAKVCCSFVKCWMCRYWNDNLWVTDASLGTCIVSICLTSHKDWFCTTSCHLKRRKWWTKGRGAYPYIFNTSGDFYLLKLHMVNVLIPIKSASSLEFNLFYTSSIWLHIHNWLML